MEMWARDQVICKALPGNDSCDREIPETAQIVKCHFSIFFSFFQFCPYLDYPKLCVSPSPEEGKKRVMGRDRPSRAGKLTNCRIFDPCCYPQSMVSPFVLNVKEPKN